MNRLKGYIDFDKGDVNLTSDGFGLIALRKSAHRGDDEGVIHNLKLVVANSRTYNNALLMSKGLTEILIDSLAATTVSIAADRQLHYEILSNRKGFV